MNRQEAIEIMALAYDRIAVRDGYGWTEEEFQFWCYENKQGIHEFAKTRRQAEIMYDALQVEESKWNTK